MSTKFPLDHFEQLQTPFYYYDLGLLRVTLKSICAESKKYGYKIHYAVKANANHRLLNEINAAGLGMDCVSGYEVQCAIDNGFGQNGIVFAGVGKTDWEIELALAANIECFNVESVPELEVIDALARKTGKTANVALRINPNVDAHTHHYITTGLDENKFGIYTWDLENVLNVVQRLKNVNLIGLHFHIGSQITDMEPFRELCSRVNELQKWFESHGVKLTSINVGGGLGVDYSNPDINEMPDFASYFGTFHKFLELRPGQQVHFELGRAVVAQCGSLISRVTYVKNGRQTKFIIIDAGMNDLIRPALYQASHKIQNLSASGAEEKYDVVGPICESSDCFGKALLLPQTKRRDIIAIRSAGAYGEIMASRYNLRKFAPTYYSE